MGKVSDTCRTLPTSAYSGTDVHKGVYEIFAYNLTTDTTTKLVDALPGGASRPELSRDQRTLAFVRRIRDKQALYLLCVNLDAHNSHFSP